MMCMIQQLVVGGRQNSSGHSQGGPLAKSENHPPLVRDQGHNVLPQGNDQETNPSKDKNSEFGVG